MNEKENGVDPSVVTKDASRYTESMAGGMANANLNRTGRSPSEGNVG